MIRTILNRYERVCETAECHSDENLRTHYYKGTNQQIFEKVNQLLQQNSKFKIEHFSKEHGEFSVSLSGGKPCTFIITLVAVRPLEIAVDIHISTESFSILGTYPYLKSEITSFYQSLNQSAQLIGTGRGI